VVFQGLIGSTGIDTIYELDMNPATPTWADITPVAPLAFGRGRFAYAARNQGGEVWMHGGVRSSFTSKDLWRLDLSVPGAATWTETVVPGGPSDRAEHSACIDAAGVFMAGLGQRATLPSRDIWRIDTTAPAGGWANLDQNDIPRGLTFAYSALDASNNRMISFGGVVDMRPVDGVHALDLNSAAGTWQRLNPTGPGPSPRFAGSMVYDDGGLYPRMILFGGRQSHYSADSTDEVWELNLTPGAEAWTLLTTSFSGSTNNPGRRSWHPAILDDSRRMIVYGGAGLYDSRQDSTFALDVDTLVWTRLATAGPTPPARVFHGANYDNLGGRNRMVVFGGYNTFAFDDTWELDLNTHTWTLLSNTGIPPIQVHSQVLDPLKGRIVVFGGWDVDSQASCGLYEFDLVTHTWVEIITGTMVPQSRYGHTAVWDTLRSRMVLAGGQTYAQTMVTQNGGLEVDLWYWGD
jgi:hypothetical protein